MSGIFKAYDIRGIFPTEINAGLAEDIGRAYVEFTGARKVVVGRDMRPHSADLFEGLAKGLTAQGADFLAAYQEFEQTVHQFTQNEFKKRFISTKIIE